MSAKLRKLLTQVKRASGFGGKRWDVALIYYEANPNRPFRPEDTDAFVWDGDIDRLSNYAHKVKVGTYLECWIYGREELEDNVYIWLDSETSARFKVCGSREVRTVTI